MEAKGQLSAMAAILAGKSEQVQHIGEEDVVQFKVRFQKTRDVVRGPVDERICIAEFDRIHSLLDGWK